jgi:hypothetical protein
MSDGELTTKTRDTWESDYKRWVRMRNPNAKTGPDEYYSIQAKNLADQLVVLSADARAIAGKISLQDRTGSQLDEVGRPVSEGGIGLPRPGAIGASGALVISCTASGTTIVTNATLGTSNGVLYHVVSGATLSDGESFAVLCNEAGPQTNLEAGEKLTWTSPPAGCYAVATVLELPDGTGLIGGREQLGDDEYRELLADAIANPAASANDAYLQQLIMDSRSHGVAVEKAFTYPCIIGPATSGFTFTLRGSANLMSRLPSSTQLNLVSAYVASQLSVTDALFPLSLVNDDFRIAFRVRWLQNGWTNATQWPPYMADASRYQTFSVTDSITFTVVTCDGVYTARAAPQAGQVFGLFDETTGKFRRKTIASVAGSGPWTITCETLANATDLAYTPTSGRQLSPWSESLNTMAAIVVSHMNSMGPGEATATPPLDGARMVRSPKAQTGQWPNEMDGQLLGKISLHSSVQRAIQEVGASYTTLVGDSTHVHLANLVDLAFLPL